MTKLEKQSTAPSFSLANQDGDIVSLKDVKGQKTLIYFYPKADTPGCTRQACQARDEKSDLDKLGIVVFGISPDPIAELKKFQEKYSLNFSLLSDPDHKTAETYGTWGEKVRFGKKSMGIIRSSFLVDEKGKIINRWYNVKPEDTVPKAKQELEK